MEHQECRNVIIEYIANNPGCHKEKVVKKLEGKLSRVPVLKIIVELQQDNIVYQLTDRENSREHKLYVNNNNILVSVSNELKEFEEAFFSLLAKINEKFKAVYLETLTRYSSGPSKRDLSRVNPIVNLISESFHIFYEVVDLYMIRSMMIWPKIIQDRDILKKLYSIIITKIADMQFRMSDLLSTTVAGDFNPIIQLAISGKIYSTKKLMEHFDSFKNCNMEKEIDPVLSSTWKISGEYKKTAYPEPNLFSWDFNYQTDDWKKLVKLQRQHPEQTYPNLVSERLDGN